MSHIIYSHQPTPTITVAERKLANKERRKTGRERHEERKEEQKAVESTRKVMRLDRDTQQRQEKRREDGTRAFTGRNLYNHRKAIALHISATDMKTTTTGTGAPADHHQHHHHLEDDWKAYDTEEEEEEEEVKFLPVEEEQRATSGAMLLAMARPAKTPRRGQRGGLPPVLTDGEMFEVVEIDGRLVALDEDGWEILPDENAEVSLLYSDIVRHAVL